jgi:hypothetical protein
MRNLRASPQLPGRTVSDEFGAGSADYVGKRTKTGNSMGFRFEGALFKSHPEFSGRVRARVIAPGRLLVTAEPLEEPGADPVIASFLAFLKQDMIGHPSSIRPMDERRSREIKSLVSGVSVDPDADLGDETLL